MKMLTAKRRDKVLSLIESARLLLEAADRMAVNAYGSSMLHWRLESMLYDARHAMEYVKATIPPATPRLLRMERNEAKVSQKHKEVHMDRDSHGFPSARRTTGGETIPSGMVPEGGKHKETQ